MVWYQMSQGQSRFRESSSLLLVLFLLAYQAEMPPLRGAERPSQPSCVQLQRPFRRLPRYSGVSLLYSKYCTGSLRLRI